MTALATSTRPRSSTLVGSDEFTAGVKAYPFPSESKSVDQPQEQQSQSDAASGKP